MGSMESKRKQNNNKNNKWEEKGTKLRKIGSKFMWWVQLFLFSFNNSRSYAFGFTDVSREIYDKDDVFFACE